MSPEANRQLARDPYYSWATSSGWADYGEKSDQQMISVLAECHSPAHVAKLDAAIRALEDNENQDLAFVNPVYLDAPRAAQPLSRFCTLFVRRDWLPYLDSAPEISRWELGIPIKPVQSEKNWESISPGVNGVVAAVIDDFVASDHAELKGNSGKSRVRVTWDQGARSVRAAQGLDAPVGFSSGVEFPWGKAPQVSNRPRAGHGTAVAGLFVGRTSPWYRLARLDSQAQPPGSGPGRAELSDDASQAPVIAVHLPKATVGDTSGSGLGPNILDGLRYIISRCTNDAKIVVNISYGGLAGPHDGTSILEEAIADLVQELNGRLYVVFPAGNSREAMCHGAFDLKKNVSQKLTWKILPDCHTPSFLEIWFPDSNIGGVEIALISPDRKIRVACKPNKMRRLHDPRTKKLVGLVELVSQSALGRSRAMALISLAPTSQITPMRTAAPHGLWTVEVTSKSSSIPDVHAWIERNDQAVGQKGHSRRQSRFSDSDYQRHGQRPGLSADVATGYVRRAGTTNSVATSMAVEVVGGYRLSPLNSNTKLALAPYSSGGRDEVGSATFKIPGPFCVAPSEESRTLHGLRVIGSSSGDTIRMRGTSMAAPLWARHLLCVLKAGQSAPVSRSDNSIVVPTPSDGSVSIPITRDADVGVDALDRRVP